jgi:hypothetical protein
MTTSDVSSEGRVESASREKRRLRTPTLLGGISLGCALAILVIDLALIFPLVAAWPGGPVSSPQLEILGWILGLMCPALGLLLLGGLVLATIAIVLGRERKSKTGVWLGITSILLLVVGSFVAMPLWYIWLMSMNTMPYQ